MTAPDRPGWLPTPALSAAIGAIALLLLLAVTLNRQDLLVIALPLVAGTVLPLLTRAHRFPQLRVGARSVRLLEGESTYLDGQLSDPDSVDLVRLRFDLEGWVELPDGAGDQVLAVRGGQPREFTARLLGTRWGRGHLERVQLSATTGHGMLRAQQNYRPGLNFQVVPLRDGFTATDLVPGAIGVVGGHRSRRPGEGVDLAGLRQFAPGDRLRRINWAVSTRTGRLHVTSTYSDRDAEVVLVIDTSAEVGVSTGVAGTSNNIDLSVRAAAAIAEHYLRNGDRVGLLDLARAGRPIRSRTGRGQLNRLVDQLVDVRAAPASEQALGRALLKISPRALVIVLSPLLSDEVSGAVAELARGGRSAVLVDTLPDGQLLPDPSDWTELAWRIQLLHRQNLIAALADYGVPVVAWQGSGSLDQVLIGLSRAATTPRLRR
ncbi:MAG TPA: DUF58 domain-containing protein [Jatrophihabitans sp.]|nr:DUF58 domain-containing protein [Jatrophihabitans sp.]